MRRGRDGAAWWWLLALLLAGALAAEIVFMRQWQHERVSSILSAVQPAKTTDSLEGLTLPAVPELESANELRERPLFISTRRPTVTPVAEVESVVQDSSGEYVLTSTILSPAGRYALARDVATGRSIILREGESEGRWSVAAIEAERVILRSGDEEWILVLRPDTRNGASDPRLPQASNTGGQVSPRRAVGRSVRPRPPEVLEGAHGHNENGE